MIGERNATLTKAASLPPTTTLLDLMRLAGGIAGEAIRHPRTFSVRTPFRAWLRRASARHGSENLVLNFGVKKILLVGGSELSRGILDAYPSPDGITVGEMKRQGMSALAPHALTISDGADWERLRAFNEGVLESGRPHELGRDFLRHVVAAFETPIRDIDGVRAAMARAMLNIVFGGKAPASLADDVQFLFGLVQNPIKRKLMAASGNRRREHLYAALRVLWRDPAAANTASLLGMAHRSATGPLIDETVLLEQFPHWMFTFTGSGTDLVARALTLILSDAGARKRVQAELRNAAPLDEPAAIDSLAYLEACLVDGAHLFPPVTRTFHSAPAGASVAGVQIPPRMEVLHSLPLISDNDSKQPRRFTPDRWFAGGEPAASRFDPFLGGVRACPGRRIIMNVSKAALAVMIGRQRLTLDGAGLRTDDLPLEFPRRGIKFRPE